MRNNSRPYQPHINLKTTWKNQHFLVLISTSNIFFINGSILLDIAYFLTSKLLYPSFGKVHLNFAYSQPCSAVRLEPTPTRSLLVRANWHTSCPWPQRLVQRLLKHLIKAMQQHKTIPGGSREDTLTDLKLEVGDASPGSPAANF